MILFYFIRDHTACTYYRQHIPFKKWEEKDPDLKVGSYDRTTKLREVEEILLKSDILHVQRAMEAPLIKVAEARRKEGHYTIVDQDDNLFGLSPFSPHYKDFGIENVRVKLPDGTEMNMWEDGKNINLRENREKQDNIKRVCEAADLVTVTTPYLAEVYKPYARKVAVLPNCVDADFWQWKTISETPRETRIYWSGGASHYDDWAMINKPLKRILDTNFNTKLVILGQTFSGTLKEMDKSKLETHDWVHYEAYPYKTIFMQPSFGIIPLQQTEFSDGKSPIKWVELASLGVPCVTSYLPPYDLVYEEGNGIYIENNDPDLWIKGIQKLIDDPLLRAKMGAEARKTVLNNFDINTQWHKWRMAYEEIMK